jgi:hypothetical protein
MHQLRDGDLNSTMNFVLHTKAGKKSLSMAAMLLLTTDIYSGQLYRHIRIQQIEVSFVSPND